MKLALEEISGIGLAELAARSSQELAKLIHDTAKAQEQLRVQREWLGGCRT